MSSSCFDSLSMFFRGCNEDDAENEMSKAGRLEEATRAGIAPRTAKQHGSNSVSCILTNQAPGRTNAMAIGDTNARPESPQ
jgi:hypothetical protein